MTHHNLHYYHNLILAQLREAIETGTFRTLTRSLFNDWNNNDESV